MIAKYMVEVKDHPSGRDCSPDGAIGRERGGDVSVFPVSASGRPAWVALTGSFEHLLRLGLVHVGTRVGIVFASRGHAAPRAAAPILVLPAQCRTTVRLVYPYSRSGPGLYSGLAVA